MQPTILTIAGSDSSGGAGIQADLKSIAANGGYGASVITALTAQNTQGVTRAENVSLPMIEAQLDAVFDDLEVAAVKTGMLSSPDIIRTVARRLRDEGTIPYVCDPVMISKSGFALLPPDCVEILQKELLPRATLVTPNVHEAEALTGLKVRTPDEAAEAASAIRERHGASAVLVKGGHLEGKAVDILVTSTGRGDFSADRIPSRHTHGTGCTYSAAIATHLGRGLSLDEAVSLAKEFMQGAIEHGLPVGRGVGPTDPFFFLHHPRAARWIEKIRRG